MDTPEPTASETAIQLLKRLKRDLMHARRFQSDTLDTYRRACTSAECDIEEFFNDQRAVSATTASVPMKCSNCHSTPADKFPLPLYYVRDHEGDQDLLVRATEQADVLDLWRAHYDHSNDTEPTYIGLVPPDTVGAIDWGPLVDNAVHFKPLPE
jgi:hypothetical protein